MKTHLLYFDGHCIFCQFWVMVFLKLDLKKKFQFISLQSEYAKKNLPNNLQDIKTIVYQKEGKTYTKSTAVIMALGDAFCLFKILLVLLLLPQGMRDFFYDWIAKNRYKWFGRTETCEIPDRDEKDRFIL